MASRNKGNTEDLDDEDTILTATITFDVTLDKDGQVINTSEGEIISETIDTNVHRSNLANHQFGQNQLDMYHDYHNLSRIADNEPECLDVNNTTKNTIQADSLASMTEYSQRRENKSILQDSLDEIGNGNETGHEEDDDDEPSTTTESLIERSKKYVDNDAGIIVLRRDDEEQNNFNINLDFDLKSRRSRQDKDFNVDMNFDLKNKQQEEKDFNIDIDFDLKNRQDNKKRQDFNVDMNFDLRNKQQEEKDFNIGIDFDLKNRQENRRRDDFNVDMNFDVGSRRGPGETSVGFDVLVTDDGDEEVLIEETLRYVEIERDDDEVRKINGRSGVAPSLEEYLRGLDSSTSKLYDDSNFKEGIVGGSVGDRFVMIQLIE